MLLFQSTVLEGDELFPSLYRNLRKLYPGTYTPAMDHPVLTTGKANESGKSQSREEWGKGIGILTNNIFSELVTTYLVRIKNISPSVDRMNRLIHNVNTVYLNTPPAGYMPGHRNPSPPRTWTGEKAATTPIRVPK